MSTVEVADVGAVIDSLLKIINCFLKADLFFIFLWRLSERRDSLHKIQEQRVCRICHLVAIAIELH